MEQNVHSAVQFNTMAIIVLILISLVSPLVGYVWAYVASLIGLVIGCIAMMKVRKIAPGSAA